VEWLLEVIVNELWYLWGIILVVIPSTVFAFRHAWRGSICFLPTTGWLVLMVFPFLTEYVLLESPIRKTQSIAILVALLVFLVSDIVSNSIYSKKPRRNGGDHAKDLCVAWILSVIFIGLTVLHTVWVADSIPIMNFLSGNFDIESLHSSRSAFSRDSQLPAGLHYLLSFSVAIFGVPAVIIYVAKKRYFWALGLFIWVVLYASVSTAIFPLFFAFLTLFIGTTLLSPLARRKRILRTTMIVAISTLLFTVIVSTISPSGILSGKPTDLQTGVTNTSHIEDSRDLLGDKNRAKTYGSDQTRPHFIVYAADRVLYRCIFTPVEVSYRWYEYFYLFPIERISFSRMVHDSHSELAVHPASAVGKWAFYERFQNRYLESAHAYASFDADSYSRFGWVGFLVALVVIAACRILLELFRNTQTVTTTAFYSVGICLIAVLSASASVQAMLVAHGLAVLLFIMFACFFYEKRNSKS
jgi:hypothetical protein